ncbi:hypothetical protein [Ideonella paludis]|uniref:hypothetical protein n=1 Tax=Ideonella paludis TaxID=1233411 RepID=UPI0036428E2E
MPDALRLQFERDTDGTGELFAGIHSSGFAGSGSAWFLETELLELAKKLAVAFPLPDDAPLGMHGGFWSKSGVASNKSMLALRSTLLVPPAKSVAASSSTLRFKNTTGLKGNRL